jgi:hypothetical protein
MKLRPVTYNFQYNRFSDFLKEKNIDKDQLRKREARKEMGLVAQEVEKAMKDLHIELENLVHAPANESDNYSLAYGELVVPLIKAVQEQQKQIEELRKIMGLSQNQPSPSAFQINPVSGRNDLQTTGVLLGQNIPNPVTRMTIIPFRIPGNCTDAAIVITSMATGQIVKAIPISCKETQLNIDASKLSSGTYSYSLYIEGKSVETKRMILTK